MNKRKHMNEMNVVFILAFNKKTSEIRRVVLPAAVAYFDEFQDIFCAPDLLLLEPHNLNLLFPILQHPQLSFTIQQIKHLSARQSLLECAFFSKSRK